MPKLFVYRIVTDAGAAPHISNGYLTLTLCKPQIRRTAKVGDYVLSLVALQHMHLTGKGDDRFYKAAYLFKITETVNMLEYEEWCSSHAPDKICTNYDPTKVYTEKDFDLRNCQYNKHGVQRSGINAPHGPGNIQKDLSGKFSLISNHFAAWKSTSPHTLTDKTMETIGLNKEQVKTATRNYFTVNLAPSQVDALEMLIPSAPKSPPCRGNTCKAKVKASRNTRKRNKLN
jgi:hypothetical protein